MTVLGAGKSTVLLSLGLSSLLCKCVCVCRKHHPIFLLTEGTRENLHAHIDILRVPKEVVVPAIV